MLRNAVSSLTLAGIVLSLLPSQAAEAKIIRSCNARWEIQYLSVNGHAFPHGQTVVLDHFTARGGCGNLVPNRCRERARSYARQCMATHWDDRWDRVKPGKCGAQSGISGYGITDIKREVEYATCCSPAAGPNGQHAEVVTVAVRGFTSRNNRCPGSQTFSTTYKVHCSDLGFKACGGE